MAEPSDSMAGSARSRPGPERAAAILAEIACAAGSAAVSLAEQQKVAAAAQIGSAAAALRAAARSLEGSGSLLAADYALRAAAEIAALGETIRERRWRQLASEIEAVGCRRPALFAAWAAGLGFLAGRFWMGRRRADPPADGPAAAGAAAAEAIPSSGVGSGLSLSPPAAGAQRVQ